MTNGANDATNSIQVTSEERQEILSAIWRRNAVRREASLPLLDVRLVFHREVMWLATQRYTVLLQPFLVLALNEIGGHAATAGRLVQRLRATQIARRRLREATGIDYPDHSRLLATGSAWYLALLETKNAEGRPVFSLHDAPHRSC